MISPSNSFPGPDVWALCERFSLRLRRGGGLGVQGKPLAHGVTEGIDFRGFDDYTPGMDVRHLDWPLFVRTQRLYVRRYAEEAAGLLVVLVDGSGSMGVEGGQKWQRARDIAAVLVFTALRELHQVCLGVMHDGRPMWLPATGGLDFVAEAFNFLGALSPRGTTDLGQAVAALPARRVTGHAVVLSDFLDPAGVDTALVQLTQRGLTADLCRVRAPGELRLPSGGQDLADPEGHSVYQVRDDPADIARIRGRIEAHERALEASARRYFTPLYDVGVEGSLSQAIEAVLAHGGQTGRPAT